ncbi:ABC transporter substrate-binding protein [Phenylobacterium sp.]|uniref:ABC transporter substrate-binding protein n=1 Tax=Phenylobacterium sp. TaxID=1871053 RepID=UPI002FC60107
MIAAVVLAGLCGASCSPGVGLKPDSRALVVGAALDGVRTLDPASIFEPAADVILRNACDQLLMAVFETPMRIGPGVAERWSVSADGRTITFTIAQGRRFASGRPVTAEDAGWSIRRAVRSGQAASQWFGQWGLTSANADTAIRVVDARTLQITLDGAYNIDLIGTVFGAGFATVLDRREVLAHARDGDGGSRWLKTHSACAGPYQIAGWVPNSTIVLARNPHSAHSAGPDRIVFWHVPESSSQRIMLEKGDLDIATEVSESDIKAYQAGARARLVRSPSPTIHYLAFNQADPRFRDPRVLTAMKLLVDYDSVEARLVQGVGFVRQSILPAGALGAAPKDFRPYEFDPQRAAKLLKEAGLGEGLEFELITTGQFPSIELAQQFQAAAASIGVRVTLRQYTGKHLSTLHRSRRYTAVVNDFGFGAPDGFFVLFFFATNPDNRPEAGAAHLLSWRANWEPPAELQKTVATLAAPAPSTARERLFAEAQDRLAAESPFVPIVQGYSTLAAGRDIVGLRSTFIGPWYREIERRPTR